MNNSRTRPNLANRIKRRRTAFVIRHACAQMENPLYALQEHMRSCPVSRKDAIDNIPTDVDDLSTAIENYLQAKVGVSSQ